MTVPTGPTDSAAAPSATPLEHDIGQMFGDYSTTGAESPEPEDSAAGTTPAEPSEGTDKGTESEPVTEATPQSEGTTPDATTTALDDDPFKDTTPAQYVVNGQSIPVEDIRVFKEGGAVIRPESLPNVLAKLAERDTLSERVRARDAEYTTLSKVSEWTGPDNQTVTGPQAAVERIVAHAAVLSENQLLIEHLTDPAKLYSLLTTELVSDGKGGQVERVILSPTALRSLQTQNELRQLKSAAALRDHYKGVISESSRAQPAPVNYTAATPALIGDLAKASNLDAAVLTPADTAMLAKQLPFHIKDGLASVEWQELVKDRIQLRTEQKLSSKQLVSSTTAAVKQGQAAMLAAARGVKPAAPKAPATPARPIPASVTRALDEGELYDAMERAGAAALRNTR